ncbi:phosphoribosyltransferase family protein [Planctomycetota bacterium]|nr:phosphoribosyltransferase family protein [Planctomycetota bacterium]
MIGAVIDTCKELGLAAVDVLLPRHCVVSGCALDSTELGEISADVLREIKTGGPDYCIRCGDSLGKGIGAVSECVSCRDNRSGFGTKQMVAIGQYEWPLQDICRALKFGGERRAAGTLALMLTQLLFERDVVDKLDVIVPVPLHILRHFQRGYNQSEEIAKSLASRLGKPLRIDVLTRPEPTKRQARLSRAQRKANVAGAFSCHPNVSLKGQTVLLLDDIVTTGATFAAAAKALKKAGAKAVYGAVAARASLDSHI